MRWPLALAALLVVGCTQDRVLDYGLIVDKDHTSSTYCSSYNAQGICTAWADSQTYQVKVEGCYMEEAIERCGWEWIQVSQGTYYACSVGYWIDFTENECWEAGTR